MCSLAYSWSGLLWARDRGFGRCMVFRKSQASLRRYNNGTHDVCAGPPEPSPDSVGGGDSGKENTLNKKYSALDIDGICKPGERLSPGSIMVNKRSPIINHDTDQAGLLGTQIQQYKQTPFCAFLVLNIF